MNKKVLIIAILVLVLVLLGLVFGLGGSEPDSDSGLRSGQKVTLEALSSQESYNPGDEVIIDVKLVNSGVEAVCLSESAIGNIRFTSFTRDGDEVEARSAPSYFLTSFSEILKSRLISVASGDQVQFDIVSSFDPGLGVQALSATMPDETSGIASFYDVEKPGLYEAELVYEYVSGPSDTCKDVLSGSTNKTTVTFTVK